MLNRNLNFIVPFLLGSQQTNSAKLIPGSAFQSSTACVGGGHCVTLPASGGKNNFSTTSVTQASIARKKTSAGLGERKKHVQINNEIQ